MDAEIRKILGLPEHEETAEKSGKIEQSVVVYLTPEQIGTDKGAHCGACFFFHQPKSECFLTSPPKCDAEHGVCDFFIGGGGKSLFQEKSKPIPQKLIPKPAAGYIDNGPTRCSTCEYWQGKKKEDPDADPQEKATCEKIADEIQAGGCCNHWEEC